MDVILFPEEHVRLSAIDWGSLDPALKGESLFGKLRAPDGSPLHRLRRQESGACVFLDENNLCRIHALRGADTKPLACRLFPFHFVWTPAGVHVTTRFNCPTVASNGGDPVETQKRDLDALFELGRRAGHFVERSGPVDFDRRHRVEWDDLLKIESLILALLTRSEFPLVLRLRLIDSFLTLISNSNLENRAAKRREEFWDGLARGLENGARTGTTATPGKVGFLERAFFSQLLGHFARWTPPQYLHWGTGRRLAHRWDGLLHSLAFTMGLGRLPVLRGREPGESGPTHVSTPGARLGAVRRFPAGPLGAEPSAAIERYLTAKIAGQSFFGPECYGFTFVDGLRILLLLYPVVVSFARSAAIVRGAGELSTEDVASALFHVDHTYGLSPLFRGPAGGFLARYLIGWEVPVRAAHELTPAKAPE